jgi:hypothetical protein
MGYVLDGLGSIPGSARFSLVRSVQTGSGAHRGSYAKRIEIHFAKVKRDGPEAHNCPRISDRGQENVDLYIHTSVSLHGLCLASKAQGQICLNLIFV